MLRVRLRVLFPLLCSFLIAVPAALAQTGATMTMTRDDQLMALAPSVSGQTGLFTTVTADTLHRGDLSFGIYYNDYDLEAAPAPLSLRPLSARDYEDMSYDLYRLSASVGYGLTDRWEVSAMMPWDRIKNNGGDRVGFINGYLYQGRFTDSGLGNLRLATKFGLGDRMAPSRLALSLFADLPTGDDKGGITSGYTDYGLGLHWTHGIGTLAGSYVIKGDRKAYTNGLYSSGGKITLPNELHIDGGLNIPVGFWPSTNWINEVNATIYNGGDVKPKEPIFLVSGIRHWFGNSGWALNAAARWNVAKFGRNNDECRFTELDDCGLGGLVGLTFAPLHLAAPTPPPPPPPVVVPPPPPPPPPTPVVPPEQPPVTPPHQATTLRTDEIHFEPGSARLTNIAKAILDDVALRMKSEPTSTALVIGYTDDREQTGPNQDLDRRRAEAVKDYLVTRHGIDPSRITVEGRDGREPVADNSTAEGRLRNRRVVIQLILP